MKKRIVLPIVAVFSFIFIVILVRFVIGGDEDTWLCKKGICVKHGNPDSPPKGICGTSTTPPFRELPFEPKKTDVPDDQYINIVYQPMQCEATSWDEWAQSGELKFIKEPMEEEIIAMYYSMKQKINIQNVKRIESEKRVCLACSICPTSHYFTAEIAPSDLEKIIQFGWMKNN
jgi:hypothetical protein